MSVLLATLVLNEMQWLEKLWNQHRDWPELQAWCFVEAADTEYARANPGMVSEYGFSTDGTSEFLRDLAASDQRVIYIPHGFCSNRDQAAGKAEARQRYLDEASRLKPEFVIATDADEFYTKDDQWRVLQWMRERPDFLAFTLPRREIWRPPAIARQPLFQYEVVGGFWAMACCHWWRWEPGMHHSDCHVSPNRADGQRMNWWMHRADENPQAPQMIHMGFAASEKTRLAKNRYYAVRGEDTDPNRRWHVQSRDAWARWKPGGRLPRRARVIPYRGPVPECFL